MKRCVPTVLTLFLSPFLVACVPPDAIMFFDVDRCPSGWSEYTNAHGRTLVGVPPTGKLGGSVGLPLSDLENRAHKHTVDLTQTTTRQAGEHNHIWAKFAEGNYDWYTFDIRGDQYLLFDWNDGINNEGKGIYPLARKVPTNLPIHLYTDKQGVHSHDVAVSAITSTPSTTDEVMPYVQLLACRKD